MKFESLKLMSHRPKTRMRETRTQVAYITIQVSCTRNMADDGDATIILSALTTQTSDQ